LFVLEVSGPDEVPAVLTLACPYFACLIAWDARGVRDEVVTAVANKLLRAGCVYVCCWGPDCERVHDCFDTAELKLRPDGPWAMSTWHSKEPLSEALWFLLTCAAPDDAYFDGCRAAIGLTVGSPEWAAEVRAALSAPSEFSARVIASDKR
jgi:hypothetical protein